MKELLKITKKDKVDIIAPTLDVPLRKGSGVCAIIAVSLILDIPFDDAYIRLCDAGLQLRMMPNSMYCIDEVLGDKFHMVKVSSMGISVNDMIFRIYESDNEVSNKGYLILTKDHIIYVKGLIVYDGIIKPDGTMRSGKYSGYKNFMLKKDVEYLYLPKNHTKRHDANKLWFQQILIGNTLEVLFTERKVDRATVLSHKLFLYELGFNGASITVDIRCMDNNFCGSIISYKPLVNYPLTMHIGDFQCDGRRRMTIKHFYSEHRTFTKTV